MCIPGCQFYLNRADRRKKKRRRRRRRRGKEKRRTSRKGGEAHFFCSWVSTRTGVLRRGVKDTNFLEMQPKSPTTTPAQTSQLLTCELPSSLSKQTPQGHRRTTSMASLHRVPCPDSAGSPCRRLEEEGCNQGPSGSIFPAPQGLTGPGSGVCGSWAQLHSPSWHPILLLFRDFPKPPPVPSSACFPLGEPHRWLPGPTMSSFWRGGCGHWNRTTGRASGPQLISESMNGPRPQC